MIRKYIMKTPRREFYINVISFFLCLIGLLLISCAVIPKLLSNSAPNDPALFTVTGTVQGLYKTIGTEPSWMGLDTKPTENYTIEVNGRIYGITSDMADLITLGEEITLSGDQKGVTSIQIITDPLDIL